METDIIIEYTKCIYCSSWPLCFRSLGFCMNIDQIQLVDVMLIITQIPFDILIS